MPKLNTDDWVETDCLGWCDGKFLSRDPINCRFCKKCRNIKEGRERQLSRFEKPEGLIRWNGDVLTMEYLK